MSFKDVKVSSKLVLAFGGSLAAVFAMCAFVLLNQQAALEAAKQNEVSSNAIDDVYQAVAAINDQNASIRGLVLYKATRFVTKYKDAGQALETALTDARAQVQANPEAILTPSAKLSPLQPRTTRPSCSTNSVTLQRPRANRSAAGPIRRSSPRTPRTRAFGPP